MSSSDNVRQTVKTAVGARLRCFAALVIVLACSAAVPAGEPPEPPLLRPDVPARGVLNVENKAIAQFRVEVPEDAVLMTISVSQSPLPLDILARMSEPMASVQEAEHQVIADLVDPCLQVSRQSLPALEEGTWYVGVAYLEPAPAVVHKRPVQEVPFSIKVSFVHAKTDATLEPGRKTEARLSADAGSMCSFAIDVPADARALRIDLDETSGALDILARHGAPLVSNADADATAMSPLGRESLVIDRSSPRPLAPGRWYVNVVHPADVGTVEFAIYASFTPDPPAELLAIPAIPCPTDPRKRAIQATVDVSTETGGASGTLLTRNGLILTNYHVVAEVAEGAHEKDPVVVAVTMDPEDPPRELFRGRVLVFDKRLDLALVQITGGLYRQPLPADYRFPTIPVADSAALQIGDPVCVVGFPSIGGTTGRVSVTLTRGVLSGFEKKPIGTLLKTDAAISPGNSGGAALDSQWRLIGVPTFENIDPQAVSRMSYIYPVSMIPAAWPRD